ncbi:hypothetical protein V8J88_21040 [Massilia sp. W12]|uniref:hypothetical protein n=1 Tax=Massilia sp. W12 TaxID=3126507 RepID=UPI0030D6026A
MKKTLFLSLFFGASAYAGNAPTLEEVRKTIIGLYQITVYEHECSTLRSGINPEAARKKIARASYEDFPIVAQDMYEWRVKDDTYWKAFPPCQNSCRLQ